MTNQFLRTQLLLGGEAIKKLTNSHIIVFGIGGVGGYVVESLVRSGVGKIDIVDNDEVCITNLNRQLLATTKTLGRNKVDIAEERIKEINPDCKVTKFKCFYLPETANQIDFSKYDYIVDAIDTVSGKIEIIKNAKRLGVPVISCMGTGNKLDPTKLEVSDIYKTSVCPLAKVMRKLCRENNITELKVIYSKEEPITVMQEFVLDEMEEHCSKDIENKKRQTPGSVAFVPSVAGLIMAGEVIKALI